MFDQPAIRIGAHRGADLLLEHPRVSRRHAYLQLIDGHLFGMDLGSRTGSPTGWIRPSDWLSIGPFRLRARIGEPPSAAEAEAPAGVPEDTPSPLSRAYASRHDLPAATLAITGGRGTGVNYPVTRVLTLIGRSPACKIRLQADGASRYYGALVRTPRGIWLVDLLSSRGVTVNGRRVRQARLRDGDRIQIGHYEMRLGLADPDARDREARIPEGSPEAPPALRPPSSLSGAAAGGTLEPAIQPVLDQVASMRQELGDQFQQALLMISQLFGAMHNDHMRIVREELEQVRILTREIQALHAASPRPTDPMVVDASPGNPAPAGLPGSTAAAPDREPPHRVRHDPQEIEALVSERLARFEAERQGRWGRVLQVLEDLRRRGLGQATP